MSRLAVEGAALTVYTAGEAAVVMKAQRLTIDAACASGALFAVDITPDSSRRSWRIDEGALLDWHRRGRPILPGGAA